MLQRPLGDMCVQDIVVTAPVFVSSELRFGRPSGVLQDSAEALPLGLIEDGDVDPFVIPKAGVAALQRMGLTVPHGLADSAVHEVVHEVFPQVGQEVLRLRDFDVLALTGASTVVQRSHCSEGR